VCWEDSETLEYYANPKTEQYFPEDISRSGYSARSLHVLCRVCSAPSAFLEIVFVACDYHSPAFLNSIFLSGKVDNLRRVELIDSGGSLRLRCARMIYRFLNMNENVVWNYFLRPGVIGYPEGDLSREGIINVQGRDRNNQECHMVLQKKSGVPAISLFIEGNPEATVFLQEKSELKRV
jgi:hypothetical protein